MALLKVIGRHPDLPSTRLLLLLPRLSQKLPCLLLLHVRTFCCIRYLQHSINNISKERFYAPVILAHAACISGTRIPRLETILFDRFPISLLDATLLRGQFVLGRHASHDERRPRDFTMEAWVGCGQYPGWKIPLAYYPPTLRFYAWSIVKRRAYQARRLHIWSKWTPEPGGVRRRSSDIPSQENSTWRCLGTDRLSTSSRAVRLCHSHRQTPEEHVLQGEMNLEESWRGSITS